MTCDDLKNALLEVAQGFFNDVAGGAYFLGICNAVASLANCSDPGFPITKHEHKLSYCAVNRLLLAMMPKDQFQTSGSLHPMLKQAVNSKSARQQWEPRAWMCLLMAQYLDDPLWKPASVPRSYTAKRRAAVRV